MRNLMEQGFVLEDGLTFEYLSELNVFVLTGEIRCLGGIEVTVKKEIAVLAGEGPTALVQTTKYSYHCHIGGGPNILRYDSPVAHRDFHHKHLFDTFGDNSETEILHLDTEESVPTLHEVLQELQAWYWENHEKIARL